MGRGADSSSRILYGPTVGRRGNVLETCRDWAEQHIVEYLHMVGDKEKEALLGTLQMEAINAAAQLPGLDDFRVELDDLFVDAEQKTLGVYYEVFEIPIDSGERFFDGYTIYMEAEDLLADKWLGRVTADIQERIDGTE